MARRGEVKHLSTPRKRKNIDSVSSGERKRNSLNLTDVKLQGVVSQVSWDSTVGNLKSRREEILPCFNGTVWNDRPKMVIAQYVKGHGTSWLSIPSITR